MKGYEKAAGYVLPTRLPVMLRVDGKCFSKYTKGCGRPFDQKFIEAMWEVAKALCSEIQGAQFAYVQSDEISVLIHNYKTLNSNPWVGNKVQKMCSIAAGIASGVMTMESEKIFGKRKRACFDARVWVLPEAEVCNALYWRQQDWTRNSVQMLARSLFSHKMCHGKSNADLREMCTQQGKNWNDLAIYLQRGACVVRQSYSSQHPHAPTRYRWGTDLDIPIFTQDRNYIDQYLETEDE